ncbi:MAG: LysM peptidoglycan-binding domain-containing protein [Synechococcus sp.]
MRHALIAALALSALMPLQAMGGTVTVRPGDTLSDIADRYGVSVRRLMRINQLRDPDMVNVGESLRLPGPTVTAGRGRHVVRRGDSLSTIASRYRVSQNALIAVNHLRDANHVEVGQTLRLPSNAVLPEPKRSKTAKAKPVPIQASPDATSHTVARGQTLTQIAKAYKVSVRSLVDINGLDNPNKVKVGTTLLLRRPAANNQVALATQSVAEPIQTSQRPVSESVRSNPAKNAAKSASRPETKPTTTSTATVVAKASSDPAAASPSADWRSYGPLRIDWSNWQTMAGSEVAPTLNAEGQPLYIAVNCGAQKLNVTGANGSWKTWTDPQDSFEQDLVKDRCSRGTN